MVIVGVAIAGLLLGSFLGVLISRWPHWRGAGTGRSRCPHCTHALAWYDLVPLVSWLSLRGACRYCKAPISALYPVLELTTAGVLGAYAVLHGIPTGWYAFDYLILFALVALFFFDFEHHILPDAIMVPLGLFVLARAFIWRPDVLVNALATGALFSAAFGLLYAVSRGRWLGFGDVKLAFVIGLLFGYPEAIGVTLIAVWAGVLVGVGLMMAHRATMKTALPFGSFWTAAAVVALLWPGLVFFLSGLIIPAFP